MPTRLRAIKRDEWMIRRSKMVIAYDENNLSNARRLVEYAKNHGRFVLNIPDMYLPKNR